MYLKGTLTLYSTKGEVFQKMKCPFWWAFRFSKCVVTFSSMSIMGGKMKTQFLVALWCRRVMPEA
jgi:hypothetical protein